MVDMNVNAGNAGIAGSAYRWRLRFYKVAAAPDKVYMDCEPTMAGLPVFKKIYDLVDWNSENDNGFSIFTNGDERIVLDKEVNDNIESTGISFETWIDGNDVMSFRIHGTPEEVEAVGEYLEGIWEEGVMLDEEKVFYFTFVDQDPFLQPQELAADPQNVQEGGRRRRKTRRMRKKLKASRKRR